MRGEGTTLLLYRDQCGLASGHGLRGREQSAALHAITACLCVGGRPAIHTGTKDRCWQWMEAQARLDLRAKRTLPQSPVPFSVCADERCVRVACRVRGREVCMNEDACGVGKLYLVISQFSLL